MPHRTGLTVVAAGAHAAAGAPQQRRRRPCGDACHCCACAGARLCPTPHLRKVQRRPLGGHRPHQQLWPAICCGGDGGERRKEVRSPQPPREHTPAFYVAIAHLCAGCCWRGPPRSCAKRGTACFQRLLGVQRPCGCTDERRQRQRQRQSRLRMALATRRVLKRRSRPLAPQSRSTPPGYVCRPCKHASPPFLDPAVLMITPPPPSAAEGAGAAGALCCRGQGGRALCVRRRRG
jgi:hypothetical protein